MKIIVTLLFIIIQFSAYAFSPSILRIHCTNDTTKIDSLLEAGKNSGIQKPNQLISFYGNLLIGTPYVAHTLEGDKEYLTIDVDELDCTTFVETLIALARTTMDGRSSWRDYAKNLESVRYKSGNINGYASRLHYISAWISDNWTRGNLKEITQDLPRFSYEIKTLDYMSKHRDSYPALKDSITFEEIKNAENAFRSHRYPIIKKTSLQYKDMRTVFKDGDIIALTTKIEGLDVSHMGVIKYVNGAPHLLNASSINKKVEVSSQDLADMLAKSKINSGIRVIRLLEP